MTIFCLICSRKEHFFCEILHKRSICFLLALGIKHEKIICYYFILCLLRFKINVFLLLKSRRYNRSLHARIEQWNNHFSFDSHDPSVFSSPTVTGLIEHYKDPSCCMFFEPMLTTPLHRNFPFGLQHLARATICSQLKYDSINTLALPKSLKMYLKEYHYKQRVRMRRFE